MWCLVATSSDETIRNIESLAEPTRTRAWLLVYVARSAGFPVIVTSGRRGLAEQKELVRLGRSRTLASRHRSGQAFDIDWYRTRREDVPRWFWDLIGPWAERELGLTWGGRWKSIYDPGHFES